MVVMVVEHSECKHYRTVQLKMANMIYFMFCIFSYDF